MNPSVSIVTVTFNAAHLLPGLVESLRQQSDREFEWVVVDGASADGTSALLEAIDDLPIRFISEPDFGIYDALNKSIAIAAGDYYLVLGADDRLESDAIKNFRLAAATTGADIISASILRNQKIDHGQRCWPWLYAHHAYVSEHAVGSLIRKSLHTRFGLYSRRYPIGADALFIKNVCMTAGVKLHKASFLAGTFGAVGVSTVDRAGTICDYFRVQFATERFKFLQILIFVAKVLWNTRRLLKSARS